MVEVLVLSGFAVSAERLFTSGGERVTFICDEVSDLEISSLC